MPPALSTFDRARTITRIVFVASGVLAVLAISMAGLRPGLHESLPDTIVALTIPCLIASAGYLWLSRGGRIEGWRLLALIAFSSIAVVVAIITWVCLTRDFHGID